jgi:hypothetical protein
MADAYSDIDVAWEVPDATFAQAVARVSEVLAGVRMLESIRSDPSFHRSQRHRVLFAQFQEIPLFWRLDLEIFAMSACRDPMIDLEPDAEPGPEWPLGHSALMNVLAAVKSLLRADPMAARGLLERGAHRVGFCLKGQELLPWAWQIVSQIRDQDCTVERLALRVEQLLESTLKPRSA